MKQLNTIEEARKELAGTEVVEVRTAGLNLLQVLGMRYQPGARSGKFHQYIEFLMPLEVFQALDIDKSTPAPKSPLT